MQIIPKEVTEQQKIYIDHINAMISVAEPGLPMKKSLIKKEKILNDSGIRLRKKHKMFALDSCPMPFLKSCYKCTGKYVHVKDKKKYKMLKKKQYSKNQIDCELKKYYKEDSGNETSKPNYAFYGKNVNKS